MRRTTVIKASGLMATLGIIGVACGGSSDSGSKATTTASAGATTTAAAATTVAAAKYGQDATNKNLYKGPGNFELDLSKCPSDYNPTQGISATEVNLFGSLPKSGPLAGFGLLADGMQSYFNYVNDNGGVGGAKIKFEAKDDKYDPKLTKTNATEAIQAKKYAAGVTILGTPNNLGIWDDMNKECMPELLNGTGAAQWGDVKGHPWTTGMQIDYFTEASLWVEWLKTKFPSGAKIAELTYNNDFGKSYAKGVKNAIKGTGFTVAGSQLHEATAPNVTNQITTLAATGADVFLIETTGVFCTQAMAEIEKGAWKPTVVMSATCGSLGQFFKPLIDQGLTGKGTNIIQTFKDVNDPAYADDGFVKLFKDTATKQGLDPKQSTYATGWIFGWYMNKILQDASALNGGLNRPNIMIAARSLQAKAGNSGADCYVPKPGADCAMPLLLNGLTGIMSGFDDAYLTEGGQMAEYTVTDPKALGTFKKVGDLLNLEGKLKNYDTVIAAGNG